MLLNFILIIVAIFLYLGSDIEKSKNKTMELIDKLKVAINLKLKK